MPNIFIGLGALNALIAIAMGAFAAHGLKKMLTPENLAVIHTAADYQFYHALGIIVIMALHYNKPESFHITSVWFMLAGIVLFSGSLYILGLTGMKWLGMITPLGGLAFLIAWAIIAWKYLFGE